MHILSGWGIHSGLSQSLDLYHTSGPFNEKMMWALL